MAPPKRQRASDDVEGFPKDPSSYSRRSPITQVDPTGMAETPADEFIRRMTPGPIRQMLGPELGMGTIATIAAGVEQITKDNEYLERAAFRLLLKRGIGTDDAWYKSRVGTGNVAETSPKGGITLNVKKVPYLHSLGTARAGAVILHEIAHSTDDVSSQDRDAAEGRGYGVEYFLLKRAQMDSAARSLFGVGGGKEGKDINISGAAFGGGSPVRFYAKFMQTYAVLSELQKVADGQQSVITGVSKDTAQQLIAEYITTDKEMRSKSLRDVETHVLKNLEKVISGDTQLQYLANKGVSGRQAVESAKDPR